MMTSLVRQSRVILQMPSSRDARREQAWREVKLTCDKGNLALSIFFDRERGGCGDLDGGYASFRHDERE